MNVDRSQLHQENEKREWLGTQTNFPLQCKANVKEISADAILDVRQICQFTAAEFSHLNGKLKFFLYSKSTRTCPGSKTGLHWKGGVETNTKVETKQSFGNLGSNQEFSIRLGQGSMFEKCWRPILKFEAGWRSR